MEPLEPDIVNKKTQDIIAGMHKLSYDCSPAQIIQPEVANFMVDFFTTGNGGTGLIDKKQSAAKRSLDGMPVPDKGDPAVQKKKKRPRQVLQPKWINQDRLVDSLTDLREDIQNFHNPPRDRDVPGMIIQPKEHQWQAFESVQSAQNMIHDIAIIADHPGMGKTLPAMMCAVRAARNAKRPVMIVSPPQLCQQWIDEFQKFFESADVLWVRDGSISPVDIAEHSIIICTYHFVQTQFAKIRQYEEAVRNYKPDRPVPVRPDTTILSELFTYRYDDHDVSPLLILDEAHTIKNIETATFQAIEYLRQYCKFVLCLTGTPLDNTWSDAAMYFLLMHNTEINDVGKLYSAFTEDTGTALYQRTPWDWTERRLQQYLRAITLRRPIEVMTNDLPERMSRTRPVELDWNSEFMCEKFYKMYCRVQTEIAQGIGDHDPNDGFKLLSSAIAWSKHPQLAEIYDKEFISKSGMDRRDSNVALGPEEVAEARRWRNNLRKTEEGKQNWRSTKIDAIVDEFEMARHCFDDVGVLIYDESKYFLDIVEVAFEEMRRPAKTFRYDGHISAGERRESLMGFKKYQGPRALLITKGTGSTGLNITEANCVIRCAPWLKASAETQASARVYRTGQREEVWEVTIHASGRVDNYIAHQRDSKRDTTDKIESSLEYADDAEVQIFDRDDFFPKDDDDEDEPLFE